MALAALRASGSPKVRMPTYATVVRIPVFISLARRFARREPRRADGRRLARATVRLWLRWRLGVDGAPIRIRLTTDDGLPMELQACSYTDMLVLREIILDGEYQIPDGMSPSTILDLGSNTGISVTYFKTRFPDAQIVVVEPDPKVLPLLQINVGGLPDVIVKPVAVSTSSGTSRFHSARSSWASSLDPPEGEVSEEIEVPTATVADVLAQGGLERVDLVKIDVEGAEWPLLETQALQHVTSCIVGELHLADGRTPEDARRMLPGWDVEVHGTTATAARFTARHA